MEWAALERATGAVEEYRICTVSVIKRILVLTPFPRPLPFSSSCLYIPESDPLSFPFADTSSSLPLFGVTFSTHPLLWM